MWLYAVITVYNVLTLDPCVKTLYTVITVYNHMDQELKHCTQ
jgi:hypothetical protein